MNRKMMLLALLIWVLPFWSTAIGQEPPQPEKDSIDPRVKAALSELRRAEPYDRSEKAEELADLGSVAVDGIAQVLKGIGEEEDENFIAFCIRAVGQIEGLDRAGRRDATRALLPVLRSASAQIRYAACPSLTELWEEQGTEDLSALQAVNAALVGMLFDRSSSAELYGPGLALFRINDIPVDIGGVSRAESLEPDEMRTVLEGWAAANPRLLPPPAQQSWPLLLARAVRHEDAAARAESRRLLVQKKPLRAIDTLASHLASEDLPAARWAELAEVLSEISGLESPQASPDEGRSSAVQEWMQRWDSYLMGRDEQPYREYSWDRFERAVRRMRGEPTDQNKAGVDNLREILLHQFTDPEQIPSEASAVARELVEDRLERKKLFSDALATLAEATSPANRAIYLQKMLSVVERTQGQVIGRQFVDPLVQMARNEESLPVLNQIAALLTAISDVPLSFHQVPEKDETLEIWLQKVSQREGGRSGGTEQ